MIISLRDQRTGILSLTSWPHINCMCCLILSFSIFNYPINVTDSYHMILNSNLLKSVFHIDGLVQDCSIAAANALEILQSCTKRSIYYKRPRLREDSCTGQYMPPLITWWPLHLLTWQKEGNSGIALTRGNYDGRFMWLFMWHISVPYYKRSYAETFTDLFHTC